MATNTEKYILEELSKLNDGLLDIQEDIKEILNHPIWDSEVNREKKDD